MLQDRAKQQVKPNYTGRNSAANAKVVEKMKKGGVEGSRNLIQDPNKQVTSEMTPLSFARGSIFMHGGNVCSEHSLYRIT